MSLGSDVVEQHQQLDYTSRRDGADPGYNQFMVRHPARRPSASTHLAPPLCRFVATCLNAQPSTRRSSPSARGRMESCGTRFADALRQFQQSRTLHAWRSSAHNAETRERIAIKKISNAFDNNIDAKRTLREIKLLLHLKHENVIQIKDILKPSSRHNFKDVYVVYELMDTDLHQIIRSHQPLSDDHCQYFIYQVVHAVKHCVTPHRE
jgi:hypothetical protein